MLAQILLERFWKKNVTFKQANENFIQEITDKTAAVIIGDRALEQLHNFEFVYDLSVAWKAFTGLPFVFAAWVSNKRLPEEFLRKFNDANAVGLQHLDEIVEVNPFPFYDLKTYYTTNILYHLDEEKRKGLDKFLEMIP
jgi:chorismate dehydratase